MSATAIGSVLLRVIVSVDSIDGGGWVQTRVLARSAVDSARGGVGLSRRRLADTSWLPATAAARYLVGARLESTADHRPSLPAPWSEPIVVDMPAAPSRAPTAVPAVSVRYDHAFASTLSWTRPNDTPYGFAIEWHGETRSRFTRIGFANPGDTSWTHHDRRPGERGVYRVVAFNAAGAAAPSAPVTTQTPRSVRSPGVLGPTDTASMAPCDPTRSGLAGHDGPATVIRHIPFGRHHVDMSKEMCGNANCNVSLFSRYGGCYRKVADLFFVPGSVRAQPGWEVLAVDTAGWPVLRLTSHMSAYEFATEIVQMSRGAYRQTDTARYCADDGIRAPGIPRDSDAVPISQIALTRARPPFDGCLLTDGR